MYEVSPESIGPTFTSPRDSVRNYSDDAEGLWE